jgi:hypothetical protein
MRGSDSGLRPETGTGSERLGAVLAALVAVGGFVYGVLFVLVARGTTDAVVRTWLVTGILGGLVAAGAFVALFERIKVADPLVATWALVVGVAGALGQTLNASVTLGYDVTGTSGSTPDPLGILRFAFTGIALVLFGWVMTRDATIPRALSGVGVVGGVLLVIMYVGRVAGFITPVNKYTLIPPFLYGLVVHPVFYLWLSRVLWSAPSDGLLVRALGRRRSAAATAEHETVDAH